MEGTDQHLERKHRILLERAADLMSSRLAMPAAMARQALKSIERWPIKRTEHLVFRLEEQNKRPLHYYLSDLDAGLGPKDQTYSGFTLDSSATGIDAGVFVLLNDHIIESLTPKIVEILEQRSHKTRTEIEIVKRIQESLRQLGVRPQPQSVRSPENHIRSIEAALEKCLALMGLFVLDDGSLDFWDTGLVQNLLPTTALVNVYIPVPVENYDTIREKGLVRASPLVPSILTLGPGEDLKGHLVSFCSPLSQSAIDYHTVMEKAVGGRVVFLRVPMRIPHIQVAESLSVHLDGEGLRTLNPSSTVLVLNDIQPEKLRSSNIQI